MNAPFRSVQKQLIFVEKTPLFGTIKIDYNSSHIRNLFETFLSISIFMTFILRRDRPENTHEEAKMAWKAYSEYLGSIKESLPQSAYDFANDSWHYDFSDHRAPHDSGLESITIREPFSGDRSQYRTVEIVIRLLGAYHDGHIEITYSDVQSYSLTRPFFDFYPDRDNKGHNDWLYDEVRLSENGFVLHEIEWSHESEWVIEAKDIFYKWLPF